MLKNRQYSESCKSRNNPIRENANVTIGDLVHLCSDKSKHHPRERYLLTNIDGNWCRVRKFVGSQLQANLYKVPLNEVYRVPSPKVHFQPSEQEEAEWENLHMINRSADFVSPAQVPRLDESAVYPRLRGTLTFLLKSPFYWRK